jgi:hypothetical protein
MAGDQNVRMPRYARARVDGLEVTGTDPLSRPLADCKFFLPRGVPTAGYGSSLCRFLPWRPEIIG